MRKLLFIFLCFLGSQAILSAQPHWTQLSFTPAQWLYSVDCVNYDTTVVVGDSGYIVRTVNNGLNWNVIPSGTNNLLYKVKFVNDTIGFALGKNGTLLRTINSGQSWSNISINTNM